MHNTRSNKLKQCSTGSLEAEMCRIHGETLSPLNKSTKSQTSPSKVDKKTSKISSQIDFKCSKCNYKTACSKLLKKHRLEHSKGDGRFECDVCGYLTVFETQFNVHKKMHSTKKLYKCEKCPFNTAHEGYFKAHNAFHRIFQPKENKKNVETKKYVCSHCDFTSVKKQTFLKHLNKHDFSVKALKVYENKNIIRCPKCIFISNTKRGIVKHMQVHKD